MEINTRLIIGLGNPGKKYESTYHNAGFIFIDYLIKNLAPKNKKEKLKNSEYYKNNAATLAKSLVFMNESGKAVLEAVKYFSARGGSAFGGKLKLGQIIIVHDDVDINLGDYKISFGKNAAGHKGIESIIKSLGTKNFWRIRIGIGKEKITKNGIVKKIKAEKYVLKKISNTDIELIESAFEKISTEKIILDPVRE